MQLAFDERDKEPVRIKFIEPQDDPLVTNQLFDLERQALKELRHDRIVKLIDGGSGFDKGSNRYYIGLENLKETLETRLRRIKSINSLPNWYQLGASIIEAICHAHQHGIQHRDIKPANIMFRSEEAQDFKAVLIDFGIAKVPKNGSSSLTVSNFYTPVYSPANLTDFNDIERDIYAIGMVLIQAISNEQLRSRDHALQLVEDALGRKFPLSYAEVLRKAIEIEKRYRLSSIQELQELLSEARYLQVKKSGSPDAGAVQLELKRQANDFLDALELLPEDDFRYSPELLENVYGSFRVSKDGKIEEDKLRLFIGDLELVCAFDESDPSSNQIYVRYVDLISDFDKLDFLVQKAVDVSRYMQITVTSGYRHDGLTGNARRLKRIVKEHVEKNISRTTLSGERLVTWKKVLEAREAFLVKQPPIVFNGSETMGRLLQVECKDLDKVPEPETCWEIENVKGVFLTFESENDGTLFFRSNSKLPKMPTEGKLKPSLGFNRPSIIKQRDALNSIASETTAFRSLGALIDDPTAVENFPKYAPTGYFNSDLDQDKKDAISTVLSSDRISLVEGPPGTGKTSFITELIKQFLKIEPNGRVLLVSQTNVAVDNAIERLEKTGFSNILRIGREENEKIAKSSHHLMVERRFRAWAASCLHVAKTYLDGLATQRGLSIQKLHHARLLEEFVLLATPIREVDETPKTQTIYDYQTESDAAVEEAPDEANVARLKEIKTELEELGFGRKRSQELDLRSAESFVREILDGEGSDLTTLVKLAKIQNDWILKLQFDRDLKSRFVSNTLVVAGTCIGFLSLPDVARLQFDLCIIDEASKATATEALVPMARSEKVVLVGDTNQLPPNEEDLIKDTETLKNAGVTPDSVKETVFELFVKHLPQNNRSALLNQYRMVPEIGNLISECFYHGRVKSPENASLKREYILGKPVKWISTSDSQFRIETKLPSRSYENDLEVRLALKEINNLADAYRAKGLEPGASLLLITPYGGQKKRLREGVARLTDLPFKVRIETFDAVQGIEADYTIISLVRSNLRGDLGFIGPSYWRRINVAMSRARFGLTIIGDSDCAISSKGHLYSVMKYLESQQSHCEIERVK